MSPAGAGYRLTIAQRSLDSAKDNLGRDNWRDAALFARAAAEMAAKAVLACFGVVPRSHDPSEILTEALASSQFPEELRSLAEELVPLLEALGPREHLLLTYGDEEHGLDPWSLVDAERARGHVALAERVTALATKCVEDLASGTPGR